jgi:acetyl-CoA synthetase
MPDPHSSLGDRLEELMRVETFPPPASLAARAVVSDPAVYEQAASDPAVYEQAASDPAAWWATQARERLHWDTPFSSVVDDSNPPFYTWFPDGTINVSYNCLDRHVRAGRGDRAAFYWRGEEGEERELTYAQLLDDVQRLANALKAHGVRKGDVFDDLIASADPVCPAEPMEAEHPLFLLYSSGSTAKPKGILHTTGGYLTGVTTTTAMVFDLDPGHDIFWCTADVGWITGHSYIVYGPLANGCTSLMFEGAPDYPDKDIWWEIVERYRVTIFYTAPTAIRACMKWGEEYPAKHNLSSLRLLGTVGEPINPKAWLWYHAVIGGERCPIVDTWWQTETGAIMITTLPGLLPAKPGSAGLPLPGISAALMDESGEEVGQGSGLLALTRPWPSMLRTLYHDPDRYVQTYFGRFGPGTYFAGDGARRDEDGYFWITGRVDDVINVSGHRLSTAEIESALVSHPAVAEAAVIAVDHDLTGQAVVAYVILGSGVAPEANLETTLREHVGRQIGKLATPDRIIWADDLPKTRSGKIMRRLLRDIADGRELGDVTTLRDASIITQLQRSAAGGGA